MPVTVYLIFLQVAKKHFQLALRSPNFKFLMASFDEFTSWVRLLLNLVGKHCRMYWEKLKFSTLLKHA